ncbi:type VI secretion system ATPase TssH, partial [Klebsiella pneumoniae]|nr:type VI secretion system ATPase TssH [Klebsiella pneumoniae]
KQAISELRELKERQEQIYVEIERAEREANLEKAARLRYGEMREVEQKIANAEAKLKTLQGEGALLKEEVDTEEIAAIVARWTGIPVTRLL